MNYASSSADLHERAKEPVRDHITIARNGYAGELDCTELAIKIIDLRMENTEQEIARLRRLYAEDRRELEGLLLVKRAAKRAVAELDGVAP
tara:strand:+ start:3238 stop:3510 length:273 start_codon:yes stop_codon:yes gene_type:complete